ncbi:YbaB/EbfC family nucleoid-associated protein [Amycolatopsis sp. FBCC-B4732]|uniref:YbaB/EbfC family nucleoid-associated protein n=1 Tax=Amycolatopsis sp. FBCC-B4732 TaxID=3079339 RepID=UPI001FF2B2B6|nr:YbaB/EbfC family nucleoid-associated protein [Amycolatopsis sp. FBCC-B4732]UOX88701.1 YbaB/EbfC family nucleoid-associated protein [Amycolatopsis sp. FBCC-B4732]
MTQSVPGGGDPLAAFTVELEEIQAKAAAAQEKLRSATASVQSPDGSVSVTLGPSGVLQDLRFGPRAYERPPQALAGLVLQLVGKAQQKVSAEVAEAFSGMVGESSAARELLDEFLPPPDPDESTPPPDKSDVFMPEQEAEDRTPRPPAPPHRTPPPPPQAPPRRRPRPAPDEDDGESNPW